MDKLWSETNNIDESDPAQFNLMEDIQCLKEEVVQTVTAFEKHTKALAAEMEKKDKLMEVVLDALLCLSRDEGHDHAVKLLSRGKL